MHHPQLKVCLESGKMCPRTESPKCSESARLFLHPTLKKQNDILLASQGHSRRPGPGAMGSLAESVFPWSSPPGSTFATRTEPYRSLTRIAGRGPDTPAPIGTGAHQSKPRKNHLNPDRSTRFLPKLKEQLPSMGATLLVGHDLHSCREQSFIKVPR